eukprot:s1464_g8.t1
MSINHQSSCWKKCLKDLAVAAQVQVLQPPCDPRDQPQALRPRAKHTFGAMQRACEMVEKIKQPSIMKTRPRSRRDLAKMKQYDMP